MPTAMGQSVYLKGDNVFSARWTLERKLCNCMQIALLRSELGPNDRRAPVIWLRRTGARFSARRKYRFGLVTHEFG